MIAALEDSPRARAIIRQAFLPAFPIRGGSTDQYYIPVFADNTGTLTDSIIYQQATTNYIGIGTTSPSYPLDINKDGFAVGPKTSAPTHGGTVRFRSDDGVVRWLFGVPGVSGSQDFFMYNYSNGHAPIYIENGAPSYAFYFSASGYAGIWTSTPLVRLDARGTHAKATTASFENVFEAASTDSSGPLALRAGIKTDSTDTNRYGAIEVDDNGTKRPLALQPSGGGVVIGGTLTKQTSGGPEKLGFQDTTASNVCVANFVDNEGYARLLIDMQGNHEWAGPSDVDQDVLLGWVSLGMLNVQGLPQDGFEVVAWKNTTLSQAINNTTTTVYVSETSPFSTTAPNNRVRVDNELMTVSAIDSGAKTLTVSRGDTPSTAAAHSLGATITALGVPEAQPRVLLKVDGSGILFTDGVNSSDASISRPSSNQIYIQGDALLAKSGGKVGFYGTSPVSKPTVTGSRGGNAALASLLAALSGLGLVVDSTSA